MTTENVATSLPPQGRIAGMLSRIDASSAAVVAGLVVLWIILWIANPRFMTAGNFNNLAMQIVAVSMIATGAVLVLLLGEIDLSLGSVSGCCAGLMGVLSVLHGVPGPLAVGAAILLGAVIGLLQSFLVTAFGVPAFVVTLGGLLAWQGVLLVLLGSSGSLNLKDPFILGLTGTYIPGTVAWIAFAVVVALVAASRWMRRARRVRLGLAVDGPIATGLRLLVPTAIAAVVLSVFTGYRGVPLGVLLVVAVVTVISIVLRKTTFGRHVYAVGGNTEAARRAGINVTRVKIVVFATASGLAAFGGVLAASRLYGVNQSSGSSDLLLLAIAGPVIGGVSLFGGRGSVWFALVGSVLIGSISNGMNLLSIESSVRFIVTGAVLVAAVLIDAVVRKRRASLGR